ncbi:DNA-binding transcriptional regulator, MarR family [Pedococcus cremeus]|uniref:DNA-binding transcriptional regulator, MarR family n=1 Tax=Pedococcus cremeus TaxID=587636 RepID=A0A1H9WGE5_9MICO|nr:MarR family transcriptional regulator [Pedococcus cremeus]SES32978.1 DNA-binding transcriptional regulator, MarR family [Pedococcus cremeus]
MSIPASRTDDAADLLSAVLVLVRTARAVGHRRTQALGPSGTPYAVLKTLAACDARAGDLATALGVSPSVISRALVPLEQAGLIERRHDADDARAWRLTLSDLGRQTLEEQHAEYVRLFTESLSDWDDDELRNATKALIRLEQVIGEQADSFRTAHNPIPLAAPTPAAQEVTA